MKSSRWSVGEWSLLAGVIALGAAFGYAEWHGRGPGFAEVGLSIVICAFAYSVGRAVS
jgi:hypothetical protein